MIETAAHTHTHITPSQSFRAALGNHHNLSRRTWHDIASTFLRPRARSNWCTYALSTNTHTRRRFDVIEPLSKAHARTHTQWTNILFEHLWHDPIDKRVCVRARILPYERHIISDRSIDRAPAKFTHTRWPSGHD